MTDNMHALTPWSNTLVAMILFTAGSLAGCSHSRSVSVVKPKSPMTKQASGFFEVTLTSEGLPDAAEGTTLGRMSIEKTFHGDLEATSKGAMLSVRTSIEGSAGYVAIERVSGTLHGRSGGFVLQHSAMMSRGIPRRTMEIVPDSGSGELKALSGTMTINIVDGKHFYELVYALQATD